MKKIFIYSIDILIAIAYIILANITAITVATLDFANYLFMSIFSNGISDNSRLIVLAIPMIIYVLFIFIYILSIKFINKKLNNIKSNKNIKIYIYILLLILLSGFICGIFVIENMLAKTETNNVGLVAENTVLPEPDRIIYKNKYNGYALVYPGAEEYSTIYSELYNQTTNIINGKVYSEEEINNMQNRGSFIELDYNSKSKNFIYFLEEDEVGIIRRFTDTGQVIKTSLTDTNSLIKKLDKLTLNFEKYYFNDNYNYNYTSLNKISEIPEDLYFTQESEGVFQKIITYDYTGYNEVLKALNFQTKEPIPDIEFHKQTAIITLSHYNIEYIKPSIGNIKYKFGTITDNYIVNILFVSKVANTNCIYYNFTETNQ